MQEAESIKRAAQKRIAPTTKRALNEEKYSIKELSEKSGKKSPLRKELLSS